MARPHNIEALSIGPDTRVSRVIRADERAVEALVELSSKFKKLRNPLLRKVMAPRVTLKEAARIGGVDLRDMEEALKGLGFRIEEKSSLEGSNSTGGSALKGDAGLIADLEETELHSLDVRPVLEKGEDPFAAIMKALQKVPEGEALKLINSFEPIPLIRKLEGQGYAHYVVKEADDLVITYFRKKAGEEVEAEALNPEQGRKVEKDPESLFESYGAKADRIDVRGLEMPEPMMRILEQLRNMAREKGLYVQHERVPRYLLPELEKEGYSYAMKEVEDEKDVRLFIFREGQASEE